MKKLLSILLALGLCSGLTACGNNNSNADNPSNENEQQEEVNEKSDLEAVKEVFTLETETNSYGSTLGLAKNDDGVKFKVYITLGDQEASVVEAFGVGVGTLIYCVNGDDSETYIVDNDTVLVTFSDATNESMKEDMENYLSGKGLTLDQVKNALKEEFKY